MTGNYTTLLGAEAVERAADKMGIAADKMSQAAKDIDFALTNHQRFMNDWLERLEGTLAEHMPQEGYVYDVRVIPPNTKEEDIVHLPTTKVERIPDLAEQEGPVD